MKNLIISTTFIILFFLPVVLYTKLICDFEDFQELAKFEKYEQNKKIEEMEKRIRILEQDNYILKYGYENEKE